MAKLTEEQLIKLMEEDKKFQEETKKMAEKLKKRTVERNKIFERYWITQQAYYYRLKERKKGLEKRAKLRAKLDEIT